MVYFHYMGLIPPPKKIGYTLCTLSTGVGQGIAMVIEGVQ